jgi:hypothetical protein
MRAHKNEDQELKNGAHCYVKLLEEVSVLQPKIVFSFKLQNVLKTIKQRIGNNCEEAI